MRQSRRHPVWRTCHPYDPDIALQVICYFPPEDDVRAVVTLYFGDKARMGDVFYNSVGARADALIDDWYLQRRREGR